MQPKWESATDPQQILLFENIYHEVLKQVDNKPLTLLERLLPNIEKMKINNAKKPEGVIKG